MDKTEKIVSAIPSAAELEQLAELHKAMGDHTRMRILWHLTQKEYCVSALWAGAALGARYRFS